MGITVPLCEIPRVQLRFWPLDKHDKIKAPPSVGMGVVVKRLSEQGFCGSRATAV